MSSTVKRMTLIQEGKRILRNTRLTLHPALRKELMEDLAERLMKSGYPEEFRRTVIEAAVKGFESQVKASAKGERPLYRPREWEESTRRR